MANINFINEGIHSLNPANRSGQSKPEQTSVFERELDRAIDGTEGQDKSMPLSTLTEIPPASILISDPITQVSGETDRLLEMLNAYAGRLENPEVSLKNMSSILEQINETAGSLLEKSNALNEKDGELKTIATRTAVTARTEYIKFQRGDYLS